MSADPSNDQIDFHVPLASTINPRVAGPAGVGLIVLGTAGLALTINQVFRLQPFGFLPIGNAFLYYVIGLYLAATYIIFPARDADATRVRFYDYILSAAALVTGGWLGLHGLEIIQLGWDFSAPTIATVFSGIMLVLVLEGVRRSGGTALLLVALLFAAYPLYADFMPGFLWGTQYGVGETLRAHVLGVESIIGIPMQVVANLIVGFVVFGTALVITGGGHFFMSLAISLMGASRGGPAKVAVLSSAFMGSLSGSVVTNILTTGPITINMMKRTGYPPHYAASVEACASTGGTLMPPVMGAVAFIMASFLAVPYSTVMIAALFPAVLFYLALLIQVDLFAARAGLQGLKREDLPRMSETLKEGWPYLLSLAVLIYMLIVMRLESHAPYYATLVLIAVSAFKRRERLTPKRLVSLLLEVTIAVAHLVSILAGIGLVVGGLSYTGVAGAFSRELLLYAGNSVPLLLIAGAVTSFVLGMGMTVSACYIFLSILLAPALVEAGLDPVASHLFILYWGMMSYITPPVALASITAANIAHAEAWRTGLYSMRLGAILFVLPFFFVVNPALILSGPPLDVIGATVTACGAALALTSAMEGYFYRIGTLLPVTRVVMGLSALALIYPNGLSDLVGLCAIGLALGAQSLLKRNEAHA
ncbi:TRAP transporter permease [Acuticoccus mangrovi]|uniref:TRAP transporter fused permease subunit n=1 Tax=Acuticoccus mangrovi TaxID=2796142 RepID=A0A934MHK9_9HYPH|nr:TRAP transporter fused permease subunit [Acuticoccus mangrovi]MBJ3777040.1 TRAP transporter fused permease subunit [Acuticoccus mangrovi]